MFEWTLQHVAFIVGVTVLTSIAVYTDWRNFRIPNKLTFPFFILGWIYQVSFWGLPGLGDGFLGFVVGFGTYLILWFVAGGGAGDTKLIGALSVWMGLRLTIWLMILSTFIVVIDSIVISMYKVLRYGTKKWKKEHLATGKVDAKGKPVFKKETLEEKRARRMLPFAIPVATATWLLMLLNGSGVIKEGQLGHQRVGKQEQGQMD